MVTVTLGVFHAVGFRETHCGHDRYIIKSCLTIYKPSLMQKLLQERLLVYSDKVRARPFDDATQEMNVLVVSSEMTMPCGKYSRNL